MDLERFSYSMIFDKDTQVPNNVQRQYFAHYAELRPRAVWMDDADVTTCMQCKTEFSIFVRKHHCRHCGRIFCYDCCHSWCLITDTTRTPIPSDAVSSGAGNSYIRSIKNTKQRVCTDCSTSLANYEFCHQWFNIFNLIGLNFQDMMVISQVNRQWRLVSEYYGKIFRNIQYRMRDLNQVEATMLINNASLLSGHSVWQIQLCKLLSNVESHRWKGYKTYILSILRSGERRHSCWSLRCSRDCTCDMSTAYALECVRSCTPHIGCLLYILSIIKHCPSFQLENYLHTFVDIIACSGTPKDARQMIQQFLMERCSKSIALSHKLFWLYSLALHKNRDIFFAARSQLIQGLSKSMKKQLHSSYEYITMLKSCSRMATEKDIQRVLENNSLECMKSVMTYPLKTEYMVIRNNYEDIFRKQSTSNPLIIPVQCMHKLKYDTISEKFLLKNDDVRQDCIIMDCITMMDDILKQNEMDFHIVKYGVLPITPKLGMVEIVQDALTIHEIQESNFSIQNYILEHNPTITIEDMRDQYTKSCAAYCLIGYLLGIGDRHLENIMITKEGFIFHIDFEFILGQDPKLIRPEIRITPAMIDAMGGFESKYYEQFKQQCKDAFHCLRRHAATFHNHLLLLSTAQPAINPNFTSEFIHSQVMKRFMVGESHADAELLFITKVIKSTSSSYKHQFVDLAHSSGQTLSSISSTVFQYLGYSREEQS